MPRRRKTQSGAPAQKIESVQGQRYGEGVAQAEMQAQLPAPDNRTMAARPAPPPQGQGQPQTATHTPEPTGAPSLQDIIMRARGGMGDTPNGLLRMPTQRPNEPVTAGLSTGPGPGREALGVSMTPSATGRLLRELAAETGNPYFARLADRSRQ